MALLFTTTGRASLAGYTCHESKLAVGHDSQVNPTPSILPTVGVALATKLGSSKAKLRAAIGHIAKAYFFKRRMSASWPLRYLKTLRIVQVVVIAVLSSQLVFLAWQGGRNSERHAQAGQRWEQTQKYWKLSDRIDAYEETVRNHQELQDLRIEVLVERVERLEQRDRDLSSTPQRQSPPEPLF